MTLKNNAKFKEELSCGSKYDMRNLLNLTQPLKSLKISFRWAFFVQSIQGLSFKNTEELSFMTANSNVKFE